VGDYCRPSRLVCRRMGDDRSLESCGLGRAKGTQAAQGCKHARTDAQDVATHQHPDLCSTDDDSVSLFRGLDWRAAAGTVVAARSVRRTWDALPQSRMSVVEGAVTGGAQD